MKPTRLVPGTAHPRLASLVAGGVALLLLGGVVAVAGPLVDASTGLVGFRVGFLGFLLVVFGASGYVAMAVFERRPEP